MSDRCDECRYWTPAGTEDSGIRSVHGEWSYSVGICAPEHPELDTPIQSATWAHPCWQVPCSAFKRQRKARR